MQLHLIYRDAPLLRDLVAGVHATRVGIADLLIQRLVEQVDLLLEDAAPRRLVLNLVRGIAACEARRVRMRSARQSTAQHARAAHAACGRGTGGLAMNAPPARWTHIVQQMAEVSDGF